MRVSGLGLAADPGVAPQDRRQRALDWGLTLLFAAVLYEGALRKWVWPQAELYLFLVKDVFLVALLLRAGINGNRFWRSAPLSPSLRAAALLYAAWVAAQALNPTLPNLTLGVFGAKNYLFYILIVPLLCVTYSSPEQVWPLLRRIFWLSIPVFLVGVAQFYSPPEAPINRYVRHSDMYGVAVFGGGRFARVTGTFPYITGMSTLIFAVCVLVLAWLAARRWRLLKSPVALACGALALIVTPMTGSRWSVFVLALSVPLFFLGLWYRGMLPLKRLVQVVLLTGALAGVVSYFGSEAYGGLSERAAAAGDAPERYRSLFVRPFELVVDAGIIGFGAGSTHQAAPSLARDVLPYSWLPVPLVEDELARVALELGLPGLAATVAIRLLLVWLAWSALLRATTYTQLALSGGAMMYLAIYVFSNSAFNTTAGILYWFFAGLLMLVVREQAASPTQTRPQPTRPAAPYARR
jgi:hypothetical protein